LSTNGDPSTTTQSEDCLFLDIYTPTNASAYSKLPVFFYIQGGGFASNAAPNRNGTGLVIASGYNIIVVNFNYRVSAWGFLASEEITNHGSINNGLKDQIKALQWLKRYIARVRLHSVIHLQMLTPHSLAEIQTILS